MIFGLDRLETDARAVARTDAGPLVEITFKGKVRDGCGNELQEFARQVIQDMEPAGVVMNCLHLRIGSWDDIGPVFTELLGRQTCKFLPFCIVARKKTAKSLIELFEVMQVTDFQNAEFFDDARSGLEYLEKRLEGARHPTVPAQPTGPGP